jgi:hypothetical protein
MRTTDDHDLVEMNREELLNDLRQNRSNHLEDVKKARKVWQKKATKALVKAAKKAQETGEINQYPTAELPMPTSYVKSYDDAIARVERDVRQTLFLDERTFAAWVLDNWSWSGGFVGTQSLYNAR